ncbi:MAG TPA: YciI family protein [Cyclobacteriaceae bacterium]|nr:YciI family protein [Cyclobacteriaceae bacterium]
MRFFCTFILTFASALVFAQQSSYTFVFLNSKKDKQELPQEEVKKIMDGHMANIGRLAKEGKLLAAGPFEGGGGIFIFNTTSVDTTTKWLSTDPGVQAKRWNIEIFPYQPRTGGVCPVGENYEMTNYHFIRFTAQVTKSTAVHYPDILRRHDDYIKEKFSKTGNVITEGVFGNDGGILVLKDNFQKEIFENDPGVQEALLQFDIKKLFIAKGSFCEK